MVPDNGVPSNSRKRKSKEVEETSLPTSASLTTDLFRTRQQQVSPHISTALRLDLNRQLGPNPLEENTSVSMPSALQFKSFTSLPIEDDDQDSLPPNIRELNYKIDGIIKFQADHLRWTLADVRRNNYKVLLSAAEERAGKKLKETELELNKSASRNVELQNREMRLRAELLIAKDKVRHLEQMVAILRAQLQEDTIRGGKLEGLSCSDGQQQEDGESSHVERDWVEPVMLACRGCGKRLAAVMMWPCRHVCLCRRCKVDTRTCPVCHKIKTTGVQVFFPQGLGPPKPMLPDPM